MPTQSVSNNRPTVLTGKVHIIVWGLLVPLLMSVPCVAQTAHSVARQWNEVLLDAIRNDFARPTVHGRNLFHTSVAMYDAWAAYDDEALPYFLSQKADDFVTAQADIERARHEAISYAA